MGHQIGFTCAGCGYTVCVGGGVEAGFFATTTTVVCGICQEIRDVTTRTSLNERGVVVPSYDVAAACPTDPTHEIELWTYPGACPKCGDAMEHNGEYVFWD